MKNNQLLSETCKSKKILRIAFYLLIISGYFLKMSFWWSASDMVVSLAKKLLI